MQTSTEESGFDLVIDAVGLTMIRRSSVSAIRSDGLIMRIGLLDNDRGVDTRKLTLQEITLIGTYTYTLVDFRMTVMKLFSSALGSLEWIE